MIDIKQKYETSIGIYEEVHCILQSPPLDCLVSYPGHSLKEGGPTPL